MILITLAVLFALGLFGGTVAALRLGWRLGRRRLTAYGENAHAGLGALEGSIYGLMGLLIAFTFTGAAARFQQRGDFINRHVSAVSAAWLRLDLLAPADQPELRRLLREHVDVFIDLGRNATTTRELDAGVTRLARLQAGIWKRTLAAVAASPSPAASQLIPAVTEVFAAASGRLLAIRVHTPAAIFLMLGLIILVGSLLAGFGMAKAERQSRFHVYGFAAIMAVAVYMIIDFEYPRLGLIRVDAYDRPLLDLRATMDDPV